MQDAFNVPDSATAEFATGSWPGMGATKKVPGEGFKCAWPPLIKIDEAVKRRVEDLLGFC